MRSIKCLVFLVFFALTAPTWADEPSDVVKKVYADWYALRSAVAAKEQDFFRERRHYFEPSLYGDLDKAYGFSDPMWPGSDLLLGGQVPCYGYTVQSSKIDGSKAIVEVFVRLGLDRRRSKVRGYKVHLVQSPEGWRISDVNYGHAELHKSTRAYLDWKSKGE